MSLEDVFLFCFSLLFYKAFLSVEVGTEIYTLDHLVYHFLKREKSKMKASMSNQSCNVKTLSICMVFLTLHMESW